MNTTFLMGLFAFYVTGTSLWYLLAGRETSRLMSLKKAWGWREGLALHFLTHVGLPMVFGIVFLTRGVVAFDPTAPNESFGFEPDIGEQFAAAYSKLPPLSSLAEDLCLAYTGEDAASERFRQEIAGTVSPPIDSLIIRSADILLP